MIEQENRPGTVGITAKGRKWRDFEKTKIFNPAS